MDMDVPVMASGYRNINGKLSRAIKKNKEYAWEDASLFLNWVCPVPSLQIPYTRHRYIY